MTHFRGVINRRGYRQIIDPIVNDVAVYRAIKVLGNAGATQTINFFDGHFQRLTLDAANCVLTLTAPPEHSATTPTSQFVMRLHLVQGAGGNHTVTWPAATRFPGGTPPVLSIVAGREDILELRYAAGNWNVQALMIYAVETN